MPCMRGCACKQVLIEFPELPCDNGTIVHVQLLYRYEYTVYTVLFSYVYHTCTLYIAENLPGIYGTLCHELTGR